MIEDPPKLRIRRNRSRPTTDQIAAFQGVPTGFVVDALGGSGGLAAAIGPLGGFDGSVIAGPALTAGNAAGDILATLAALNFVQNGDVLVSGAQGFQGCAAVGDSVCGMARNSGAVAFVTDGPVRDIAGIDAVGLPVFGTGITPNSPGSTGPGTVGMSITVGGVAVDTGDMVIADRDGVVVVPFGRIDTVIASLDKVQGLEEARDARVAAGLKIPDHIAAMLSGGQVTFED